MYPVTNSDAKLLFFFHLSMKTKKKMCILLYLNKKLVILYANCYLHISI